MLTKTARLKKSDFNHFFSIGTRRHSPHLTLVYSVHDSFHASVVVSKKVVKTAVGRNKIRRQVYSLLHTLAKQHQLQGVYIVIVKKPTTPQIITSEITSLIGKLS